MRKQRAIPAYVFPRRSAYALLADAQQSLVQARGAPGPAQRFVYAHLAALRAAAALVAANRHVLSPTGGRGQRAMGRPPTVWQLLFFLAPEFSEWAEFFAAGAGKRAACEAGVRAASEREANDLLRGAEQFLALVEESIGMVTAA